VPRKGSPYGPAYERARKAMAGARCHVCGQLGSDSVDHVPALGDHEHLERSGCCRLKPAHLTCNQRVSGGWRAARRPSAIPLDALEDYIEPDGLGAEHDCWEVAWLDELRDVPGDAAWPRFMTAPHPCAVGSYGAQAAAWLRREAGITLRWWQRLALTRQLEHDAEGGLVWVDVLLTTARQVGKSTLVRGGATWRLHHGELLGETQTLVHTGKDLPICKEVQRLARAWAKARGYPVREQNGNEEITEPLSGSRWIVRGKSSVYGYAASVGLVDEAWGVAPDVIEDGLEATMLERRSPQLVLASTAHRSATALFPLRRVAALDELAAPSQTLLVEWAARRDALIEDRQAWREASPHWTAQRQRLIESRLARVLSGQSLDPDEDDPVESFRAQILNIWPISPVAVTRGEALLDAEAWAGCGGRSVVPLRRVAAVADAGGHAAIAYVARDAAGCYEVDGDVFDTWGEAWKHARWFVEHWPGSRLVVGDAMRESAPSDFPGRSSMRRAGAVETRRGLPLLRSLVAEGRLVHEATPALDAQMAEARVRRVVDGLVLLAGTRSDCLRAALWALGAAQTANPQPQIH
jgi:hypothetical protein